MQLLLVKNRVSPDKRLFIGNPYEWRGRRGQLSMFESIHPPPSLLPPAFHKEGQAPSPLFLSLRLIAKQLVPIRSGNWVDIGNESEEQITGVGEGGRRRRRASSQRGITAFVPRMAREHFPEEARNTISRWILEPTPPLPPPVTYSKRTLDPAHLHRGCSISPLLHEGGRGRVVGGRGGWRIQVSLGALNITDSI